MSRKTAKKEVSEFLTAQRFFEYELSVIGFPNQQVLIIASGLIQANAAVKQLFPAAHTYNLIKTHNHAFLL